jgi:hypothetical protein
MSVPTSTNLPRSGPISGDDDALTDFDGAGEILRAWGNGLRPDPDLTVSEWADRHRMLSGRASAEPGRYRTVRTPYMREIMDRLSPGDPTQRIVFMKAAQVGATEAGNNWIGFAIHQAPGPMLAVQPTVELAKRNSRQRIDPLIDESPELRERVKPARSRDAGNTMLSKEFAGGILIMTGANSAVGLRSTPARYIFLDEVDAYPASADEEGDPAGLVMGTAEDMRAMAEALDKVKGSLVSGYAAKSGRTPEEVSALMAAETWFDASDAVAQGFADRLIEPVRIAANFDIGRFRNAPPVLVEQVEADQDSDDAADCVEIEADEDTDEAAEGDQLSDVENEQAAAADTAQPPAETPPPSGAPPDPAAIRADAIGHARAVIDLCLLAGQAQMAGRFLEENASLDEVRAALLAAKAEAEPEIAPHHPQPGRSSAARPWGEIVARTFKLKG